MKRIITVSSAILIFISILAFNASALNIPKAKSNFFVNDYANVISNDDENKMQKQGETLYKDCGAQVVVVTVKSLDGADIDSYSLELARSWGIGSKDKNDGVLLLLSVEDRKVKIEVGYGLEGAIPDSKAGRILDTYGVEYFKNNDFSSGLTSVYNSIINEVYIENGISPSDDYTPVETSKQDNISGWIYIAIVLLMIILPLIRRRRRRPFIFFGGPGGFSGGSSGGFSGGGSGGFSGGGGSFGGGGSSRGF